MRTIVVPAAGCREWSGLLVSDPDASVFHTPAWLEALTDIYSGYSAVLILAGDGTGRILGGLPVIRSVRCGLTQILSLPFGTYGTPLVAAGLQADRTRAVHAALIDRWRREALRPGVVRAHLVIARGSGTASMAAPVETAVPAGKDGADPPGGNDANLPGGWRRLERTHLVDLSRGFDVLWREGFSCDKRAACRRADRLGVHVEFAPGPAGAAVLSRLYAIQASAWRDHTPYPSRLFHRLQDFGPDKVRIWVAFQGRRPVEAALALYHGSNVSAWVTAGLPEARSLCAGQMLYTVMLRDAIARGYRAFNLGGSRSVPGLEAFKAALGGRAIEYTSWLYDAGWFRPLHRLYYRLRGIRDVRRPRAA